MNDVWYEVSVRFDPLQIGAEESLKLIFVRFGFSYTDLIITSEKQYSYLKVYCSTQKKSDALVNAIKALKLKNIRVSQRALGFADWRDKWKRSFKPFSLTDSIRVVPLWRKDSFRRMGQTPIFLDTVSSFGTGLHETTRFMANIVEDLIGKFDSVFDIGTGTGILSLVAHYCGAKSLYLTDIDPHCIEAAKANFQANHLKWDWSWAGDFRRCRVTKTFDCVLANIITDELIALREKLIARVSPGKYLAVSGISVASLSRFKRAFRHPSLRCLKVFQGKKWCALLYQKTH